MKNTKNNFTYTNTLIELSVPNFDDVMNFYSKLEFEKVWEEEPRGMNGYLVIKRNDSVLCFFCGNENVYKHPFFTKFSKTSVRGYGVEISIPVENIDEYYSKVVKSLPQKSIFQKLKLQPWGVKDFRLVDPFGYFLRINEPTDFLNPVLLGDNEYNA